MTHTAHRFYIGSMVIAGLGIGAWLFNLGAQYYQLPLEERFFHTDHETLKPSGFIGHGLGIVGTLMMLFGVAMYMIRKRWKRVRRWGLVKHWLEFHIFLCTVGPMLILFHTSFKFGGLVSVSFWSMVAVFLSGIIGRFIYIQIPRRFDGTELSLDEVDKSRIQHVLLMQKLFKWWHVAHLPFALVMIIVLLVHVVTAVLFGYQWIF
jgi:hypothetical protein